MEAKRVIYQGMTFEMWDKSFRMVCPYISPLVHSFTPLNSKENMEKKLNEFLDIVSIGIKMGRYKNYIEYDTKIEKPAKSSISPKKVYRFLDID